MFWIERGNAGASVRFLLTSMALLCLVSSPGVGWMISPKGTNKFPVASWQHTPFEDASGKEKLRKGE